MNKEEAIKQFKNYFPDGVETIVLTKEEYDKQLVKLQYENIELKLENLKKEWEDFLAKTPSNIKVEKAIEYIENNFLYHYGSYEEPIVFEDNYIQDIVDILKGKNNDK